MSIKINAAARLSVPVTAGVGRKAVDALEKTLADAVATLQKHKLPKAAKWLKANIDPLDILEGDDDIAIRSGRVVGLGDGGLDVLDSLDVPKDVEKEVLESDLKAKLMDDESVSATDLFFIGK